MENLKITIFGSSVALRIRPIETYPKNKNYGKILEEKLSEKYQDKCIFVQNFGFSRATIREISSKVESYITTYPDYFILNIGVPDASTREIPYWFAQILNSQKDFLFKKIFSFIHTKFIKKHNSFFVKLRLKRPWISKKEFRKTYSEIIKFIKKDTNAQIINLSINPPNERVEKIIPGTSSNYAIYNNIIKEVSEDNACFFLDLNDLSSETDYPDGIHYNVSGHEKVAAKILKIISLSELKKHAK